MCQTGDMDDIAICLDHCSDPKNWSRRTHNQNVLFNLDTLVKDTQLNSGDQVKQDQVVVHRELDKQDQKKRFIFLHSLHWILKFLQQIFNCSKVAM